MQISEVALFFLVFLSSLAVTQIVKKLTLRFGFTSKPKADRWNARVVPMGGGFGMAPLLILAVLLFDFSLFLQVGPALIVVFVLGIVDDFLALTPVWKLGAQAVAAAYVVAQGFLLPLPWPVLSIPLTFIWLVGMTNALNLIDNMDGLAGGITVIASLTFFILFRNLGSSEPYAVLALITAAVMAGFLVHNYHPARIFMGDSGSLPIGFILALLTTKVSVPGDLPPVLSLAPGLLVLAVPLFDTALVVTSRGAAGRCLLTGNRDHSSHRLVQLGMSETSAVWTLYGLGCLSSLGAFLSIQGSVSLALISATGITIVFTIFGMFLLGVPMYPSQSGAQEKVSWDFLPVPLLRSTEAFVDLGTVLLSWMLAHLFHLGQGSVFMSLDFLDLQMLVSGLVYVIGFKILAFAVCGTYGEGWRVGSFSDLKRIVRASVLGSLLLVAGLTLVTRFENNSRMVILLDWLFTFVGMLAVRGLFTLVTEKMQGSRSFTVGMSSVSDLAFAAPEGETDVMGFGENSKILRNLVALERKRRGRSKNSPSIN